MTKSELNAENIELQTKIVKTDESLVDLLSYLMSSKFHVDTTVQVNDVIRRIQDDVRSF
tara:strand:+ start:156 stop:332 length:177 start_codon:yes stop_codon:yes gene_type:complete